MADALTRLLLLALALSQGVALLAGLWGGAIRLAGGIAFVCPSIILGVCLGGMGPRIQWGDVTALEAGFLIVNLASAAVSLFLLRTGGRPAALFWAVWTVNSLSCAMMIYLAFFFRLF